MQRRSDRWRDPSGSAFLLMLMVTLAISALVTVLWQLLRSDWQALAAYDERQQAWQLAEVGIEKSLEQLGSDPTWSGTLQADFPADSGDQYRVIVSNDGGAATLQSEGQLSSGHLSNTLQVQLSIEDHWPWEL